MDDIRQYWLDQGLRAASELMVSLMQSGMDEQVEQVMDIAKELVDRGAKG